MSLLEARRLTKSFGGLKALACVDLQVEKGEIVGIIGPNGAGKTTLFNLLSGYLTPDEGEISFKGVSLIRRTPHEICHLGLARTFQIVQPFPNLTTFENALIGAFNRTRRVQEASFRASEILKSLGLFEKREFLAKTLTISDRKRLEMARALATQPDLLLLDEVLAGLNPAEIDPMIRLIQKIREQGITLLIIEHVLKAVMSLSDRIVVLHHGEKIAEGSPQMVSKDKRVIEAYLGEVLWEGEEHVGN
jgi:branched-chain amino acid transport system ATP-binding protein